MKKNNKFKYISGVVLLSIACKMFAAPLTKAEQQLQASIVKTQTAQLTLLRQLVEINSGTANVAGVRRVGRIMQAQLTSLGFNTRFVEEPASMHRAPTLIAERHGKSGKRILLIGHLDTVFAADSPFQHYKQMKHRASGPGVIDDKGGLVVMLYALKALKSVHALNDATMTVVLTGDEEESGKPASISRKPLLDAAKNVDVALEFEPSLSADTASVGRRGISNWKITSHGNEAHSATIFVKEVGDGAIYELARILQDFRTEFNHEKYLTVNPGRIAGGNVLTDDALAFNSKIAGKENVVAKIAVAHGDVRYLTNEQKDAFFTKAQKIVSEHLQGTKSELTWQDGIPAMQPKDSNFKLLKQYSEASVDLGLGEVHALDSGLRGAGDISYVAEIVPANLVGLGPVGSGMHSVIETIEIPSLTMQTQRAALLMYRLLKA